MPRFLHGRGRRLTALLAVVVIVVAGGFLLLGDNEEPVPYRAHAATIDVEATPGSEDREQLDTTVYIPDETPAPAVLVPHGFGGDKRSVERDARELAERGFVVLTWSARGFGESTGQIALNDPDREVADASRLLDHLSGMPEVRTDEDGDPRVGVTGGSYGGALALLLAGTDDRVDAIAPAITYNDLGRSLLPNHAAEADSDVATPAPGGSAESGVLKQTWIGTLFSAGTGAPTASGDAGPDAVEAGQEQDSDDVATGPDAGGAGGNGVGGAVPDLPGGPGGPGDGQDTGDGLCGRFTAEVCAAFTDVATNGEAGRDTLDLLHRVSPASVTDNITVPTFLVQGEHDTLFGLDQADANAREIAEAGGDVSVAWYAGGHDGGGPGPTLRGVMGEFLWHHLTGEGEDPAAPFAYDVTGALRAGGAPSVRNVEAPAYPGVTGDDVQRRDVQLTGPEQQVVRPPGGTPSSISGIPGLNRVVSGTSRLSGLFTMDPPGQAAMFTSQPMNSQLLAAGAPTVRLQVTPEQAGQQGRQQGRGQGQDEAVLFAKVYDVNPDGTRTLPGNAVAPIRVPLAEDGSPTEVDVTLPGIVRPFESEHRLQLVVSTTDQSFHAPDSPAAYRISLADDRGISVPVVAGTTATAGWPVAQLAGIGGALAVALAVAVIAAIRRKRSHTVDPELAETPMVISGLTKSYPGGLTAVSDLSFRVEPGQVLGLLGPNGAGKTTTLRMLMGLITPTEGEIRVFGHRVTPGAPVLSRIGSFVEGAGFLPHLSGAANLELYWQATGRPVDKAHVAEALEIAGLGDAVHRKVRTYSQGMRQRLAIAQAMLGLPELLVLDEPTNGLDPPQIHQMREVLRRYAATGRTVVVSSHLLAEVEQTCTDVVVMHRGKLIASGGVHDIIAAGGEATFRVDDADRAADTLRTLDGVSDVEVDGELVHADLGGLPRSEAVAALVRADVSVEQAGPRRRLEDAFLQLVGEGDG
ncbi:ABC transporter ATP-binding protein [Saccharomonospora sp. CUA-673]|uniref:alpha/beta fold hydrolase n=1 Tax=Saccharomonospora sp. CUA-673 TaxID=1904969 RepID=UPI000969C2CB|nr:alpha/beta fold hydrolase [Saccharomonospora sp. CUA-673]OLT43981.1 ABC transporter ATP-binding protein [Saccharomonospora sp. CUA-673]